MSLSIISYLLDSGSTFSIMPYHIFTKLNIHESNLNTSIGYNIDSASHNNKDAVLGTYLFKLQIKKSDKSLITCPQLFSILRKNYSLEHVLLGEDFLIQHNCNIKYDNKIQTVVVKINDDLVTTEPILNVKPKAIMFLL